MASLLSDFGFPNSSFQMGDFVEPDQMIQLGRVPNRIDLLTGITGVVTQEAFQKKVPADLDGIPVFILSKDLLIQNKRAVGRPQDIADLAALHEQ
jgi:hypothetical protein